MNQFSQPPEDLDYSIPLEPMRIKALGEQRSALQDLLTKLVLEHPTKLTKDQKHSLRDVYRQILVNVICNSLRRVYTALPRGTAAFAKDSYWNRCGLTARFTAAALDRLVDLGLIVQMKGVYNGAGGFSRLTRIYGTEALASSVNAEEIEEAVELAWDDNAAQVVLTDFPYKADTLEDDHPDVLRVRTINNFLKNHQWQQSGPVRVRYKKSPVHSGRVYTRFQNMPKELRSKMRIDGKQTVELDFKANHLMMLIAMMRMPLPNDPYLEIASKAGDCTRDQIKSFITSALGASEELKAFQSLTRKRFNRQLFNKIKDATTELYPGIPLFKGIGAMLQSLEGQIALDIMFEGSKAGIVVLPVHDSFITTEGNEMWLLEEMIRQWSNHVGADVETKIEKKEKKVTAVDTKKLRRRELRKGI